MTITSPTQPTSGPGGSLLQYSGVVTTSRTLFPSQRSYWIVTPSGYVGGGPVPTKLPLVVFLHGYAFGGNLNTPAGYQSWVEHIARQGNIVIFPKYQEMFDLNSSGWTGNAIASVKDALAKAWPLSLAPDLSLGMLLVGHSAGCLVAVNMANRYVANGLPVPKGFVLAMPYQDAGMDASLAGIPASAKLLCVVGNADTNVGRSGADAIFDRTSHVTERSYVRMSTDNHGSPTLVADHHVAEQASGSNALDWNGLWKFSDAMADYVFRNVNGAYVFGGGAAMTGLGSWSDGVPVTPMTVTTSKP